MTLARSSTRRSVAGRVSSRAAMSACSDAGAATASRSSRSGSDRTYWPPRGTTRSRSISERTVSTANSGIPSARVHQPVAHLLGQTDDEPVQQLPHVPVREGLEVEHGDPAVGGQRRPLLEQPGPGEDQHEHRERRHRQQVLEEADQAVVGVLGVVDDEHDRLAVADPLEERRPGVEEVLALERADRADAEQGARAAGRSTPAPRGPRRRCRARAAAARPGRRRRRPAPRPATAAAGAARGSPRPARRTPRPRRRTGSGRCASAGRSAARRCTSRTPSPAGSCRCPARRRPAAAPAAASPRPRGRSP